MDILSKADIEFVEHILMPYFMVKKVQFDYYPSKHPSGAKYPDIWLEMNRVPRIVVTKEWKRQDMHERRKRLVHEFLHIRGLEHDEAIGFSTFPWRDSYSVRVYREIIQ